jgi:NAD(P)H-flavin reductase/ferredoxin
MRKMHRVIVNGEEFSAARGDVLLDAALINGVHIPHDCRSGHCGTCQVRVIDGEVFGGGDPRAVRACQCRIIADVSLAVEEVPEVTTMSGRVTGLEPVAPDVIDVAIALQRPTAHLPGQYFQVQFRGFPARCFSPTIPLDRFGDRRSIHLHVRRLPGGRVSADLGRRIGKGHRVKLKGPFGSAYLRPRLTGRLVLVASGTGFAPIWSIADAAMRERYDRELVLVAGARSIESLYMLPALWRLATCPNVTIVPVTGVPQHVSPVIQTGRPTDYLPELRTDDIVYAAGAPPMVAAVKAMAEASGALCHADPFVPSTEGKDGLISRAMGWLTGEAPVAIGARGTAATRSIVLRRQSRTDQWSVDMHRS